MSTPGVNLVKWFPPVDDHLTPEQSALHLRQLYTATNQHDQAIETVDRKVEKLSAAMTTTAAAATASTNTSTTITITEIEGFGNLAAVNNQTGQTSYTVQSSDNGSLVVLNDASPIAVTLNSVVMAPYFVFIANQGAGTATLSASSGSINGTTTIPGQSSVIAFYDGANWWIWWIDTVTGVFPVNTPAVLHEWLASYNSTTGAFTQTQPAFTDISGSVAASQLPALTGDATSTAGTAATTVVATHLTAPLPVAQGGTGTATPSLVAGTNVTVTGPWPNQTVNASSSGTVSSVALTMPAEFTVTGSPITGAGTFAVTKTNESANTAFLGPSTGSPATPTFRAVVPADLPTATNVAKGIVQPDNSSITISGGVLSATGSPVTPPYEILLLQSTISFVISTNISLAFTSANTKGSCIVVSYVNSGGVGTISDTNGNAYTQYNLSGGACQWVALNVKSGANTIAVSGGGASVSGIAIYEYSNVASVDDKHFGVASSGTTIGTGSATASISRDWVHMACVLNSSGTNSNASNWPLLQTASGAFNFTIVDYGTTLTAAGSTSNTFNTTAAGITFIYAALLILKPVVNVMTNPMTTSGDFIVGGTGGTPTRVAGPLPVANGGSGSASPALVAGTNITITGSWPNQTITGSGGGAVTSLTTIGSSGASSLTSGVLNIPVYSGSGGTPTTVPGLVTWLDASQLTGYSTGNSVVSWDDLARGVPVGVIGSGTAPTYQASVINSLPVIRFAGSSTMQNVGFPVNSQQYTVFMVMKISSLSQAYTAVWGVDSTTAFLIKSNGKTALYFNNTGEWDGTGAYTFGTSLFQVISLQIGPTSYIGRVALAADQTAAFGGGTGASQAWQLGNQNGQAGRGLSGDVAEVIMYSRNLTSTQLSTIENYLKTKYGL